MGHFAIKTGDALVELDAVPDGSVQTCITSPPYYGLRDYEVNPSNFSDGLFCLGQEPTPEQFVDHLVEIFAKVHRVMSDDGTLWLNIGDSYYGGAMPLGRNENRSSGNKLTGGKRKLNLNEAKSIKVEHAELKKKDLIGIPWTVALAMRRAGWYLRSDIIWYKTNAMPEGHIADRPHRNHEYIFLFSKSEKYYYDAEAVKLDSLTTDDKKNLKSVWPLACSKSKEDHFAVFPESLVENCIKAGSSQGDTVMDIFSGTATTGVVALKMNRNYIGIELNQIYAEDSKLRLSKIDPLFTIDRS